MIVQALAFYLFAFVTVTSGVMVISARNPVHSVLFLIAAFFIPASHRASSMHPLVELIRRLAPAL